MVGACGTNADVRVFFSFLVLCVVLRVVLFARGWGVAYWPLVGAFTATKHTRKRVGRCLLAIGRRIHGDQAHTQEGGALPTGQWQAHSRRPSTHGTRSAQSLHGARPNARVRLSGVCMGVHLTPAPVLRYCSMVMTSLQNIVNDVNNLKDCGARRASKVHRGPRVIPKLSYRRRYILKSEYQCERHHILIIAHSS
jgi:hypothetical protein